MALPRRPLVLSTNISDVDVISSFASHLPTSLLLQLYDSSEDSSSEEKSRILQTSAETPLFFIDISGFTKMSTILSVNDLSLVMNEYFTSIINVVTSFGGSVQKFAGDAVFVTFPPHPSSPPGHRLILASLCAEELVQTLSDYLPSLFERRPKLERSSLNIHCGLAFDECIFCEMRSELVMFGEVIEAVGRAEGRSDLGEVYCCPKTKAFMMSHPEIKWLGDDADATSDDCALLCKSGSPMNFTLSEGFRSTILDLKAKTSFHPLSPLNYKKSFRNLLESLADSNPSRLSSLFQTVGSFVHETAFKSLQESPRVSNELRPVYTVFLNIIITSGSGKVTFTKLDEVFKAIAAASGKWGAMIRQFIVDDKGTVCILSYGLKGGVHKNMNSMLFELLAELEGDLTSIGVKFEAGVTLGKCYTGIVGSEERGEYAVMGSNVNLAARLMCADHSMFSTIVSEDVRERGGGKWRFEGNGEVKAKGFKDRIKTYGIAGKIMPARRTSSTALNSLNDESSEFFVGRDEETGKIMDTAESIYRDPPSPKLVILIGEGGVGKSSLAKLASQKLSRRGSRVMKSQCVHTGGVMYPLSSTKSWIRANVRSIMRINSEIHGGDYEKLLKSIADRREFEGTVANEQLARSLLEIIGLKEDSVVNIVKVPLTEILLFCCEIIKSGNASTAGNVLLLDDMQFCDNASKTLIELLMKGDCSGSNLIVIATSRESQAVGGRSLEIPLRPMGVEDLALMVDNFYGDKEVGKRPPESMEETVASKKMRKRTSQLIVSKSADFLQELVNISGGNPFFASEILAMAQNERAIKRTSSLSFTWEPSKNHAELSERISKLNSVSELILAKFDRLSALARSFLSACSVIGSEFSRSEVRLLFEENEIQAAMEELMLSEIICIEDGSDGHEEEKEEGEGNEDGDDGVMFKFVHQLWWTTVLENMISTARVEIHRQLAEKMAGGKIALLLKRLHHAREAGLARVALEVSKVAGRRMIERGWNTQASEIYTVTLQMEAVESVVGGGSGGAGVTETELALECMTDLAKVSASLGDKETSAKFYQSALHLYTTGSETGKVENNELSFAIVSGIMLLLKWGTIVDEDGSYESNLVSTFITSARKAGSDAHVSRALALKSIMHQRRENYIAAISAQAELEEIYDVQRLSRDISRHYGSDRAAQNFSVSAQWMLLRDGDCAGVREQVEKTVRLLEAGVMERRNVHNSFMVLFPLTLVLAEFGEGARALDLWVTHIVEPFKELYTPESQVFFKPVFRPMHLWLMLKAGGEGGLGVEEAREILELVHRVVKGDLALCSSVLFNSMSLLGRDATSLVVEMFLKGDVGARDEAVKEWCEASLKDLASKAEGGGLWWLRTAVAQLEYEYKKLE
ncbi:hypothetical protein TrVE_jg6661 [Triparma verrucosa]|uniref:Guanylate cyclase domain-containing protein n=1 Tax=Triparma verrucosa TaxID=1606542 RepID=A0A9W7EIM6_9STRA|nr:hypothetical protein TrVE_jg6661 [Triparma verrucosa]